MRTKLLACVVVALLCVGCSQRGVVVEKRLKPSPFAYSQGTDAIYTFLLRDEQGRVHRQMVTPDVFQRYEIGDFFDDQQAGAVHREGFSKDSAVSDSKEVKPVRRHSAVRRKHETTTASHKPKRRHLRAVAKTREEDSQIVAPVIPHEAPPDARGLDIRP